MKGMLYAEYMRRRGRAIFEGAGCYWYSVHQRMIMSIPYHEPMEPSSAELSGLLSSSKRIGARYLTRQGNGLAGGLYVRRKSPFDISSIHHKSRSPLRRALEKCVVREVDRAELLAQGMQCNLDSMTRQGRFDSEFGVGNNWRRVVDATYASTAVKVIGSFVDGTLAAYSITLTEDRWHHILHAFSAQKFLSEYFPNTALTFELTRAAMENPAVDQVSYGVAGLVNGAGLHQYKLRHGYEFAPYGYAFALHPAARFALTNSLSTWGLKSARRYFPGAQFLERAAAVLDGARATSIGSASISRRILASK
jgi:hypothetical protein